MAIASFYRLWTSNASTLHVLTHFPRFSAVRWCNTLQSWKCCVAYGQKGVRLRRTDMRMEPFWKCNREWMLSKFWNVLCVIGRIRGVSSTRGFSRERNTCSSLRKRNTWVVVAREHEFLGYFLRRTGIQEVRSEQLIQSEMKRQR